MPKYDIPNDSTVIQNYNRYVYLLTKPNRITDENTELASLQTQLKDYLITSDDWNNVAMGTPLASTTGTANTYAANFTLNDTTYYDGMRVSVKINVDSTAASTLNVNGWGAKPLKKASGTNIANLKANGIYTFVYNATTGNFILQGEGGEYGTATAGDVRAGKTIGTDNGLISGTLPVQSTSPITVEPSSTDTILSAGIYDAPITVKAGGVVNGQTIESLVLGDAVSTNDAIFTDRKEMTSITPAVMPSATLTCADMTSDGVYLAVGGGSQLIIYKKSGDTFTKLADPAIMPASTVNSVSFTTDGTYLAVGTTSSPFLYVYKRSGDTFTKLANPSTLPAATANSVAFTPDGSYLMVGIGGTSGIYVLAYQRSGDTFTKLADTVLGSSIYGWSPVRLEWNSTGTICIMSYGSTTTCKAFTRNGSTFTFVSNLVIGVARWSQDDKYVFISTTSGVAVYASNGDGTFAVTDNTTVTDASRYLAVSPDGSYVFRVAAASPYFILYNTSGGLLYRKRTAAIQPTNVTSTFYYGLVISPDSNYVIIADSIAPYLYIYKLPEQAYETANHDDWRLGARFGYAKAAGAVGASVNVVITNQ